MALVVLDASIVVGALEPRDAHHARIVATLKGRRADELVLPASAYAESLVGPLRRGPVATARVDELLARLGARIHPLDVLTARRAAELRAARRSLGLPDALVLATGDVLGADVILTADASWGRVSRRVEVV